MIRPPQFNTRGVAIRPLGSGDFEPLLQIESSPALIRRWRHEGRTPTLDQVRGGMLADTLCAFLVESEDEEEVVGLVSIHNPNHVHRRALMSMVCFEHESPHRRSQTTVGLILAIHYAFTTWDLHKISAGVAEYNLDQFASELGDLVVEEGRLSDHIRLGGRYWSWSMLAIFRDTWFEAADFLMDAFGLHSTVADGEGE